MLDYGEVTLDELCVALAERGVDVHRATVGRFLHRLGLSDKKSLGASEQRSPGRSVTSSLSSQCQNAETSSEPQAMRPNKCDILQAFLLVLARYWRPFTLAEHCQVFPRRL